MRAVVVTAVLVTAVTISAGTTPPLAPAAGRPAFSVTLAGDSIISRKLSIYQEPEFLRLIELVRGADVAFTNLEMLFHDYESYPMHESGGTWMRADPALAKELAWAGFDLVSRANNHAGDYGVGGMRTTTRHVREAGLVQAGVGDSLAEAREARFLDTPKARVALVSAASTFPDHARAGDTRGDMPARPGLNPLRFRSTTVLTRERFEALRAAAREARLRVPDSGDRFEAWGRQFEAGDRPGVRTEPLKTDLEAIARVVASASTMADYTIVSVHAHEGGSDRTTPADFLVTFAHAMIDAGADMFAGHGPHVLRGIEIYKGRPIFYSLGDFMFENETILRFPAEAYEAVGLGREAEIGDFNETRSDHDRKGFNTDREVWESAVATLQWTGRTLTGLQLHPITLGFGLPVSERGRPKLASGELASHVLGNLRARSQPFGTRLDIDGDLGRVELAGASSASEARKR